MLESMGSGWSPYMPLVGMQNKAASLVIGLEVSHKVKHALIHQTYSEVFTQEK